MAGATLSASGKQEGETEGFRSFVSCRLYIFAKIGVVIDQSLVKDEWTYTNESKYAAPATQKYVQSTSMCTKCCTCHAKVSPCAPNAAPGMQMQPRAPERAPAIPRESTCRTCHAKVDSCKETRFYFFTQPRVVFCFLSFLQTTQHKTNAL